MMVSHCCDGKAEENSPFMSSSGLLVILLALVDVYGLGEHIVFTFLEINNSHQSAERTLRWSRLNFYKLVLHFLFKKDC